MQRILKTGIAFLVILFSFNSCKNKDQKIKSGAFVNYISYYTSGIISKNATIKVRLATAEGNVEVGEEAPNLFSFKPSIKGITRWADNRTIEFVPTAKIPSGKLYKAEFDLGGIRNVSEDLKTFKFGFQSVKQNISVQLSKIYNKNSEQLTIQNVEGSIQLADPVSVSELQDAFKAEMNGKEFPIIFESTSKRNFRYIIKDLPRIESAQKLQMTWDGSKLEVDDSGELAIEIPALSDFKIIQTKVYQQPQQYISVVFSDPLKKNQNLKGLVELKGNENAKLEITGNEIKIYPSSNLVGTKTLKIQGVRNIASTKLKGNQEIQIQFEDVKPIIELLGKGVIIPDTDGIIFPFRSVNIKAVRIKIIRIYEDNVAQFLQVNKLDGQRELKRVGRTVHSSVMDLTSEKSISYGAWNTFALKLDELIAPEPGAIYQVVLSFGKKQSLYACSTNDEEETSESEDDDDQWENQQYYGYDDYYYEDDYYYRDYDYKQRNNPCDKAYYYHNTRKVTVKRNVLASNLGIIAKKGNDENIHVAVTDLRTTQPQSGVTIKVLNYQQQTIGHGKTDERGMSIINAQKGPFLLVAEKGKERGYLRLDNSSSLSTSKFDVSGQVIQKGLKGFIYGERGVWRPGDTLFLNFMLQDKSKSLPKNHPVTFELLNPDGQLVNTETKSEGVGSIYNFTTKTDPSAITGNWLARVRVGGSVFSKKIKIETVKPNRLKVKLDFGKDRLTKKDKNLKGTLTSKWLHGAVAKNLKADVKVSLKKTRTVFPKYKNYIFDNPGHTYESTEFTLFNGTLDEKGEAPISADLRANNTAPGMLKANFSIKVFEKGGEFSVDRFTIPYASYTGYAGVQLPKGDKRGILYTDQDQQIDVVTVDNKGNPVNGKAKVEIYKLVYRYWWERNGSENLSSYQGSSYKKPVSSKIVSTKNGRGSTNFKIGKYEWGRYYVRVTNQESGHATGKVVYVDWPNWYSRQSTDNPGGASMLVFSTDKQTYSVGDPVNIAFPSSEGSRALVSIESGSKVIENYWVNTTAESTKFSFIASAEMTPNVYINITVIQPHNSTKNDLPIRLYGITPIKVEDPATKLKPILQMAETLRPEEKVSIQVSENQGKAMEYTVAVVDEGLLDITRFKTPNPWNTFYARESLGVRSWDMYDYVLGAYAGEISGLLQIGGDGELIIKKEGEKANRFKPVVKFLGPFSLPEGKTNTHEFVMPSYVGSVKTMVIASHEGAYGETEKVTPVKQPLMVLATLPRVISPTEKVKLPVTVFATENKIKNVTVEVKTNSLIQVEGNSTKNISFSKPGEELITFDVTTPKAIGVGKVEILVRGGGETAHYEIELDVRPPNPPTTKVIEKVVEGNQEWNPSFKLAGIKGTNSAYLEVSSIPPMNLEKRLKYLLRYPHGCVEQTTSAGFPQLFLNQVLDLDDNAAELASDNVTHTINKLLQFQRYDGGFSYWPGRSYANDWGSTYAGHFLLEAQSKGFAIPQGMISKWVNYQKQVANNWSADKYRWSDLQQAYRLFTLALANKPQMGAMNRLKERGFLSTQALWRLAGAYALAGQESVAKQLVFGKPMNITDYRELSYSFGSANRDKAMILETLLLLGEREKAATLVKELADKLNDDYWMSTQTTAYTLVAISKFIGKNKTNEQMRFSFSQDGTSNKDILSTKPVNKQDLEVVKTESTLQFKNNTNGVLFARIVTEGVPVIGDSADQNNDLQMSVNYFNLNGTALDPKNISQGTDFKVEVTLKNPGYKGDYQEMALTQMFPSGWEIQNMRMDNVGEKHLKDKPDYADVRDDRVNYYYNLKAGKSKTFVTLLNASYLGKFYQPAVYTEAMYDNTINAKKAGRWVKVVK